VQVFVSWQRHAEKEPDDSRSSSEAGNTQGFSRLQLAGARTHLVAPSTLL
jgi:hypothetical protein